MTMPRHIHDQISAYRAHMQKASDHLSKANYEAKKLLLERGIEVNAQDHDYRWTILGEKCEHSVLGVHVYDKLSETPIYCIFCSRMGDWD